MDKEKEKTIDVVELVKQTMRTLKERHEAYPLEKDIWRAEEVCGACRISEADSQKKYLVVHTQESGAREPVQRISVFPFKADKVAWGWMSDGYGSVIRDSSFLIATPEDGLIRTGSALRRDTVRAVSPVLKRMIADPLSVHTSAFGSIGWLFEFNRTCWHACAPDLLADAIEEILESGSDKRWINPSY